MLAPVAKADLFYTLNLSGCCGSGPFGVVDLHQVNANTVQVTETLAAGNAFEGAPSSAASLSFDIDKTFSYVSSTLTAGFTSGGANTSAPFGSFGFFVDCTDGTVCGSGTNPPLFHGPLTFEITNASGLLLSDFVANAGGYYFASDIGRLDGEFLIPGSVANNSPDTGGTVQPAD